MSRVLTRLFEAWSKGLEEVLMNGGVVLPLNKLQVHQVHLQFLYTTSCIVGNMQLESGFSRH